MGYKRIAWLNMSSRFFISPGPRKEILLKVKKLLKKEAGDGLLCLLLALFILLCLEL